MGADTNGAESLKVFVFLRQRHVGGLISSDESAEMIET